MIDRIRQDIQERLDQLLAEAHKLRNALIALDPREQSTSSHAEPSKSQLAANESPTIPSPQTAASPKLPYARTPSPSGAQSRNASGATRAKVLNALSHDGALTAGEVAQATGLGRASVSTTLSKLAKSGEIAKAERGYRLTKTSEGSAPK